MACDCLGLCGSPGWKSPFVVLTANAGASEGFDAHRLGAFALLEKPSSPDHIARILRTAAANRQRVPALLNDRGPAANQPLCVEKAFRLIQESFRVKGLSLHAIAKTIGASPGHLGTLFRKETGSTLNAYLHHYRVSEAVNLLRTTTLSVKAVADECGYHGSSELDRHFRRRIGESPRSFREADRPSSSIQTTNSLK